MFTLSGGHVFPLYDAAVKADPPMRLLDVRHEQTAVFAAEATAKLTRTPGLPALTGRRPVRSAKRPAATFASAAAPSAAPSTMPTTATGAPSTAVRKTGRIG